MNFKPNFTRSPAFIRFKRSIERPEALEYLFNLGCHCQTNKTSVLPINDDFELGIYMGLPDDIDACLVMKSAEVSGLIIQHKPGFYRILFFDENNEALISCWKNGERGGRPLSSRKQMGDVDKPSRGTQNDGVPSTSLMVAPGDDDVPF